MAELAGVLSRRERLGKVFARHAYGMREWVDLFSARVPAIADAEVEAIVAELVADNARHMMLFRERGPLTASIPTPTSARLRARRSTSASKGSIRSTSCSSTRSGSLDHFDQLLDVYGAAAGSEDAAALAVVRTDVARMRAALRPFCGPESERLAAEAHELYRRRELVETPLYAHAC